MVGGCQLTFIRMTNYRESNKRSKERQTTTVDVHFRDVTVKRELIKVSFFFSFSEFKNWHERKFFTATSFCFELECEELDFADNLSINLFRLNGVLFRRPVGDVTFAN